MARSLVSMISLNVILALAAMVIVLFSLGVSSKLPPTCYGACAEFPECTTHCKILGLMTGKCLQDFCCCFG
ncbi:hypothetical protein JHK82_047696 [Glycine max]|uniref:LCR-like protein n=1 Tax=Glycine soja TaxID=3848 RepID=A0A445G7I9_GLYSO|nr:hypothetical protein JHK86_047582 [Glycine max]KAG4933388.1 hypothetical protein JHK87_047390 [Glycine soja]KAG4943532.1 hypothetical protein JHK85_048178 [Glycine max]KAG5097839.1 hypothetical protein JHK82_047693 [Glycine max]KAG5097842.1 hypothetical protein JHK82_047696 [Glycine max]